MNAMTALRSQWLDKMHKQTKEKVLAAAQSFENENGYRPPYRELVSMATEAYEAVADRDRR